jgi:hypothetical protein
MTLMGNAGDGVGDRTGTRGVSVGGGDAAIRWQPFLAVALLAAFALLMTLATSSAFASQSRANLKNCGQGTRARGVGCETARKAIASVDRECLGSTRKICRVRGFACVVQPTAGRTRTLRCTKGKELILRTLRRRGPAGSLGAGGNQGCTLLVNDDSGQSIEPGTKPPSPIDGAGRSFTAGVDEGFWSCDVTYHYAKHDSSTGIDGSIDIQIKDPIIGSNYYSCYAQGSFHCFGPREGSTLLGDDLKVIYYVCIPGEDVKTLGRHLPGYCGAP